MSNSAWCDLNSKGDISKLHDLRSKPNCICQKQSTISTNHYMLEAGSIKSKLKEI